MPTATHEITDPRATDPCPFLDGQILRITSGPFRGELVRVDGPKSFWEPGGYLFGDPTQDRIPAGWQVVLQILSEDGMKWVDLTRDDPDTIRRMSTPIVYGFDDTVRSRTVRASDTLLVTTRDRGRKVHLSLLDSWSESPMYKVPVTDDDGRVRYIERYDPEGPALCGRTVHHNLSAVGWTVDEAVNDDRCCTRCRAIYDDRTWRAKYGSRR